MGHYGLVPDENSTGEHHRRGGITRTGNALVRRLLVETAWHYQHRPGIGVALMRLDRNVLRLHWDGGAATQSLGWLLAGVGVGLFAWARITFSRQHTTLNPYQAASSLCTGGPFRFSRNPFYLVDWLILAGVSVLLNTAWPLAFAPLIWAILRFGVIGHEEARLEAKFGDVYRDYKARVRRWA